jgi:hypothetical protein
LITGVDEGVLELDSNTNPTVKNILARVPITTGFALTMNYTEKDIIPFTRIKNSTYFEQAKLQPTVSVNFYLARQSGKAINLNGHSWSASFLIKLDC